ncbi:MAG: type II secretion system protein GspN, partial [Thermodesulfobacteriota bacterium]|nr:type II secretion system protein GspN [Thermodesulfobacteriota bacterium]
MKSPWKKLLVAAGLTAFILAVALLATHFLFPYRIAAQTARNRIEASSPLRLSFEGPEPGWPFYYSFDSVHISAATSNGIIDLVHFDEVELHVAPLDLLTGCPGVSFRAKAGPGLVRGRAGSRMGKLNEYHINIKEIYLPNFAVS